MTEQPDYPNTYREQRLLEKRAGITRANQIAEGISLPPACGFTYVPRKPKRADLDWKPTPAVCFRNAGAGTNHLGKGYCDYHEVMAIRDPVSHKQQIANAHKEVMQRAKFFGNPRNIDPHTALLEEIQRTAGLVTYLEDHLQKLDDSGLPVDEILTQWSAKEGAKPSVWMDLFMQERKHLVATCVAAIKAGVAERKVQIAEKQGRLIAAMMMAFMHDPELGLSPEQISMAPQLVRKHLLSLPQAASEQELDPQAVLAVHRPAIGVRVIDVP